MRQALTPVVAAQIRCCQNVFQYFLEKNYTIQKSYSKNKKSSSFHSRSKNDGIMVIFGSGAESRPAWTRMVAVVYGSEGGELGFPSAAQ